MRLLAFLIAVAGLSLAWAQTDSPRYSGPITITRGGVYRGNWRSLDPKRAAVTIKTDQPVVIENSNIQSRGDLILTAYVKARLTVRNTRGVALNPNCPLARYCYPGRFLHAEEFRSLTVLNNEMVGTSGMYFRKYLGDAARGESIRVIGNRARNIDGRYSTGPNTFSSGNKARLVQFVQFNDVRDLAGAEIAWNEVINEPGKSRPEESVNMYVSSGTAKSPIRIHDNYIQGAYPANPLDPVYSGGGMMLGDGSAKTLKTAAAYIQAYHNVIIGTGNQGIAIAAGHDIQAYENRVLSSGYLPDGRPLPSQNVGIYVWDFHGDRARGTFFNNSARDNLVGWNTPLRKTPTNNWWFPTCPQLWPQKGGGTVKGCSGNRAVPGRVTQTMERQEYQAWLQRVKAKGVQLGVRR